MKYSLYFYTVCSWLELVWNEGDPTTHPQTISQVITIYLTLITWELMRENFYFACANAQMNKKAFINILIKKVET